MTLSEQIDHDLKEAMKARDAAKLGTLRMVKSALKYAAIEMAAKEKEEIAVLTAYLPAALSAEELTALVKDAIAQTGATGKAQMGAVMKEAQAKAAGRADGKSLSAEVQKQLP